jgi:hypothetical protein
MDVMAHRELPHSQAEIQNLRSAITMKLWGDFTTTKLSGAERDTLDTAPDGVDVCRKFDCYIIEAAQQYGARLLLSDLVMDRVWSWQCGEKDGLDKLERLFTEIHKSARVALKESKGTITDRHRATRDPIVKEFTELRNSLRLAWPETPDGVRRCIEAAIDGEETFKYLKINKAAVMLALADDDRAMKFRGADLVHVKGDLTPARFYDQLVALAENRDPESVRQDLY